MARHLAVIFFLASAVLAAGSQPGSAADLCGPRSVAISDAESPEGDPTSPGSVDFTVLTTGCASGEVDFQVVAGSATPVIDFTVASGRLSWAWGDTTERTISIAVVGDTDIEPDETLTVELVNPAGLTITDGVGAGMISDDDPFTISIDQVKPSRPFCFEICVSCRLRVVASAPAPTDVIVHFATHDGTAVAGADYTATMAEVVIPAGATEAEFGIGILDDTVPEQDEYLYVSIFQPSVGVIGSGLATVTLVDE